MELDLFYAYLEFQKNNKTPFSKKLLKTPIFAYILFLVTLLSCIFGIYFVISHKTTRAIISIFIETICYFISDYYIEYFTIKNSAENLKNAKEHYSVIKEWLQKNNISNSAFIEKIKQQIFVRINDLKDKQIRFNTQIEKWLNLLVIPIILIIANFVVDSTNKLSEVIIYSFSIFIICLSLYNISKFFYSVFWFSTKLKIERLSIFADDLQGVLYLDYFDEPN